MDLATTQEAITAFPASVWGGGAAALPPLRVADTMQGQLEGPAEALYFADGEAEAYRGGRDSLKATWQVVARAELEPTDPEVPSMHGALAAPVPALS